MHRCVFVWMFICAECMCMYVCVYDVCMYVCACAQFGTECYNDRIIMNVKHETKPRGLYRRATAIKNYIMIITHSFALLTSIIRMH